MIKQAAKVLGENVALLKRVRIYLHRRFVSNWSQLGSPNLLFFLSCSSNCLLWHQKGSKLNNTLCHSQRLFNGLIIFSYFSLRKGPAIDSSIGRNHLVCQWTIILTHYRTIKLTRPHALVYVDFLFQPIAFSTYHKNM